MLLLLCGTMIHLSPAVPPFLCLRSHFSPLPLSMHHHLNVSPFLPPPHLSPSLETRGGGLLFLVFLMLSLTRQTDLEPTIFSERAEGSTKEGSRIFFCVRGCRMRPEASKSACFAITFVFHPVGTWFELCSRQSCESHKEFQMETCFLRESKNSIFQCPLFFLPLPLSPPPL